MSKFSPHLVPHWRVRCLAALLACAASGAVLAQEHSTVEVLHVAPTPVTQVVVGGTDGRLYRMATLQELRSDTVLVIPAMVHMAQPFSVQRDSLQPLTSLQQLDAVTVQPDVAPVPTGLREVHSFYRNVVYEVTYQQGDSLWVVETTQAPDIGPLQLSADMQARKRPL